MTVMVRENRQEKEGPMEERVSRLEERMNERFDRVSVEVKADFDRIDERFDRVEAEMKLRFGQVDERFDRVEAEIKELRADNKAMLQAMNEGFARVHTNMVIGFATIVAALIGTAAF
ncbi:MAG TPA: hypothetical protein VLI94_09675 [Solirubrobacterales bacterium]|nr:hypothetical protein [Solirubrobacterales bacterium]